MKQRIGGCVVVLSLSVVVAGQAYVFSEATQIAVDDYTYDGADVVVDGYTDESGAGKTERV